MQSIVKQAINETEDFNLLHYFILVYSRLFPKVHLIYLNILVLKSCIYIGDIGDNKHVRDYITLYKIKEPELHSNDTNLQENVSEWQVFSYHYPKNYPYHFAEAILIDAISREFIVITKTKAHEYTYSHVYSARLETNSEMVDTRIIGPYG